MVFHFEAIAKILSPILTIILGAILKRYFERRAKIVSFIGHVSAFKIHGDQDIDVFTHSIIIRNTGNKSAKNIRIGHNSLPPNYTVYPKIQYSIENNPDGASEIVIPALVPKEQITISYLYFPPITWDQVNSYTKYEEGFAKVLNVIPMPQPPKWIVRLIWLLMFVGSSVMIFWLTKLAAYMLF